ncbi:hypothetical protein HK099_000621 [Clydaea vesicula]|uniref:Glutamate decarboxylase n=1 Tax=Clydaea vesicula TaxID=447962 RepID=A0AAD5TWH0_9FUNG|nr:hypothetical protein HK099_000621 [Clydaea vesicula]KAJ3392826.1 hypothetical protein HDU92_008182 [Lobulomyces angularis]
MTLSSVEAADIENNEQFSSCVYGFARQHNPTHEIPEEEMPPTVAYAMIQDELAMDGKPCLNLASFVTTYMEEEAIKLMTENMTKNFIDYEEYPATIDIHNRCVNMIARLFNAPFTENEEALGCSTIGSSEAIILSVLAMKRRWQQKRKAANLSTDSPNLVMGANVQVCWEKAVNYLEIEAKYVYCTEDCLVLDPKKAVELCDENTIGICLILGSTYNGEYEDVKAVNELLEKKCADTNGAVDIPIHVDAASGGFVAPFINPELEWDFRLPRVVSINVSGHKYGLVFAGVGWAIWRSKEYLPQNLIFTINYLGAEQNSFTLNFSKGSSQVIAQYYVLIRLGKSGFRAIMRNLQSYSDYLGDILEKSVFKVVSKRNGEGLPLVAFKLKEKKHYDEFDIANKLREKGWIVPAYTCPPSAESINILRVVVREDFSKSRCNLFLKDIAAVVKYLETLEKSSLKVIRTHTMSAKDRWGLVKNVFKIKAAHKISTHGIC